MHASAFWAGCHGLRLQRYIKSVRFNVCWSKLAFGRTKKQSNGLGGQSSCLLGLGGQAFSALRHCRASEAAVATMPPGPFRAILQWQSACTGNLGGHRCGSVSVVSLPKSGICSRLTERVSLKNIPKCLSFCKRRSQLNSFGLFCWAKTIVMSQTSTTSVQVSKEAQSFFDNRLNIISLFFNTVCNFADSSFSISQSC